MKKVNTVLTTELNAKNKIQAINAWAIPFLMYTFGILTWSKTDLQNLNRKVRMALYNNRSHHIHSATERLYLPRKEGGRGLLDLQMLYYKQVNKFRQYFIENKTPFMEYFKRSDFFTPLNLAKATYSISLPRTQEQLKTDLLAGPMKGKYPKSLYNDPFVDKSLSTAYLTDGYLMSETEGFIHAIQDQVMKTRNYMRYVMKVPIETDLCRLCNRVTESIQHLSSGCSVLAPKEYTNRHNLVGNILHQELLKKVTSSNKTQIPHYLYNPAPVIENEHVKICWNLPLQTEVNIIHNRPDILFVDKNTNTINIIDVTIPLDDNLAPAYSQKINKYEELRRQLKHIYNTNHVTILPIVISSNGLIHKNNVQNLQKLQIENPNAVIRKCQKSVILSTTNIIRKILSEEM